MSKPSFLIRGWSHLREAFGRLGNKIQTGDSTDSDRAIYKEMSAWMRDAATAKKHTKWQRLYDEVYAVKKDENLADGLADRSAMYQAHLAAQAAVVKKFDVTDRAVRKSIITYE